MRNIEYISHFNFPKFNALDIGVAVVAWLGKVRIMILTYMACLYVSNYIRISEHVSDSK